MTNGRSNLNFQTKKSGVETNSECPVPVVGLRRRRQKRSIHGEASQNADLDESKLVDVKQGTKTVREYREEFLQKSRIFERECDEEELACMFHKGLREELREGVRAANCGWILCHVSDVADEAEKVEAKLSSTKGKLPLVFEESTNVDCGHSHWKFQFGTNPHPRTSPMIRKTMSGRIEVARVSIRF